MNKLLNRTLSLISELQSEQESFKDYRSKALKYYHECGCSTGGFFLLAAFLCSIGYWIFVSITFQVFVKSFILIFIISVIGKLLGISVARIRLLLLYSSLRKKLSKKN